MTTRFQSHPFFSQVAGVGLRAGKMLAEGGQRSWGENSALCPPPAARPCSPKRLHTRGAEAGSQLPRPCTEAPWGRHSLVAITMLQVGTLRAQSREGLPPTVVSSRSRASPGTQQGGVSGGCPMGAPGPPPRTLGPVPQQDLPPTSSVSPGLTLA